MAALSPSIHSPLDQLHTSAALSPLDHMHHPVPNADENSHYLKMEDLHTSSTSPAPESFDTSPPPVFVQSKPAKKRKSWGQELPEPKTALPPRKRAKTDDEKEQRRIERIKRNRAAAHNSRERKRQETETLAVALAKANAELEAYKKLHGPLPAHIVLPEVHLSVDEYGWPLTQQSTSHTDSSISHETVSASTPAPSLVESHGSLHDPPSPVSPTDSIFQNTPHIKQEPHDSSFPITLPPAFDSLDAKPTLLSPLDPTQHSAAMLCDLPCRSSPASSSSTWSTTLANFWWTKLFLYLMTTNLQSCYRTVMVALWTLSPSRMARCVTQASTLRSISPSTTSSTTLRPFLLPRSTPRRLALCNAATGLGAPREEGALSLERETTEGLDARASSEVGVQQAGHQGDGSSMALTEDQSMGDDGDENGAHGVES